METMKSPSPVGYADADPGAPVMVDVAVVGFTSQPWA